MELEITLGTPAQRLEILKLLRAQLDEHSIELPDADLAASIDGIFADSRRGAIHIATSNGAVVGISCLSYIWVFEHGGLSSWLEEIYVLPELRGKGIGQRLLEATLNFAQARGCKAVDLDVESDHERVQALYARNGFRKHARTRWVKEFRA